METTTSSGEVDSARRQGELLVNKTLHVQWHVTMRFKSLFCIPHQRTPLHVAARGGHKDTVEYLADKRARINIPDKYGVSTIDVLFMCQMLVLRHTIILICF